MHLDYKPHDILVDELKSCRTLTVRHIYDPLGRELTAERLISNRSEPNGASDLSMKKLYAEHGDIFFPYGLKPDPKHRNSREDCAIFQNILVRAGLINAPKAH